MTLPGTVKLSPYVLDYPCPDHPGQGFLYSTRKGSSCLIGQKTISALKQGRADDATIKVLTRLGMLTDDPELERKQMCSLPETLDSISSTLRILVTLGMGCNFGCLYCYEGEKGNEQLSARKMDQLVRCIQDLCTEKTRKIHLDFYGGEPLLYTEHITTLVNSLLPWMHRHNHEFSFTLISNGSLLKKDTVRALVPLGLKTVRVTLDGPPEYHNQSRPYKDGRASFDRIINNLQECCQYVPIHIGGNYSRNTFQEFPRLLDILLENNLGPDKLPSVNFSPVMQTGDRLDQRYTQGCSWCGEPWVADAAIFLRQETIQRGFAVNRLIPSPCMMYRQNIVMVNWDGRFYKCPVLINRPEFAIGALPEFPEQTTVEAAMGWKKDATCRACPYLPLCFGGCAVMRLERKGTLEGTDCWRPFYERVVPAIVYQDLMAQSALSK